VDRQEAALVVVGIEERQLLVAIGPSARSQGVMSAEPTGNHVDRVVNVEHDRLRRRGVAGAVERR
jgi:hypothetical protein